MITEFTSRSDDNEIDDTSDEEDAGSPVFLDIPVPPTTVFFNKETFEMPPLPTPLGDILLPPPRTPSPQIDLSDIPCPETPPLPVTPPLPEGASPLPVFFNTHSQSPKGKSPLKGESKLEDKYGMAQAGKTGVVSFCLNQKKLAAKKINSLAVFNGQELEVAENKRPRVWARKIKKLRELEALKEQHAAEEKAMKEEAKDEKVELTEAEQEEALYPGSSSAQPRRGRLEFLTFVKSGESQPEGALKGAGSAGDHGGVQKTPDNQNANTSAGNQASKSCAMSSSGSNAPSGGGSGDPNDHRDGSSDKKQPCDGTPAQLLVDADSKNKLEGVDVKGTKKLLSFVEVATANEERTLQWPAEMIQVTSGASRLCFSCNPLYFDFGLLTGRPSKVTTASTKSSHKKKDKKKKRKKHSVSKSKKKKKWKETIDDDPLAVKEGEVVEGPEPKPETPKKSKKKKHSKKKRELKAEKGSESEKDMQLEKNSEHVDQAEEMESKKKLKKKKKRKTKRSRKSEKHSDLSGAEGKDNDLAEQNTSKKDEVSNKHARTGSLDEASHAEGSGAEAKSATKKPRKAKKTKKYRKRPASDEAHSTDEEGGTNKKAKTKGRTKTESLSLDEDKIIAKSEKRLKKVKARAAAAAAANKAKAEKSHKPDKGSRSTESRKRQVGDHPGGPSDSARSKRARTESLGQSVDRSATDGVAVREDTGRMSDFERNENFGGDGKAVKSKWDTSSDSELEEEVVNKLKEKKKKKTQPKADKNSRRSKKDAEAHDSYESEASSDTDHQRYDSEHSRYSRRSRSRSHSYRSRSRSYDTDSDYERHRSRRSRDYYSSDSEYSSRSRSSSYSSYTSDESTDYDSHRHSYRSRSRDRHRRRKYSRSSSRSRSRSHSRSYRRSRSYERHDRNRVNSSVITATKLKLPPPKPPGLVKKETPEEKKEPTPEPEVKEEEEAQDKPENPLADIPTPKIMHAPSIPLPPGSTSTDTTPETGDKQFIGPVVPSSHHLAPKMERVPVTLPAQERFQHIGPNDPLVFKLPPPPAARGGSVPPENGEQGDGNQFEIPTDQIQKYNKLQEQAKKHANRIQRLAIGEDVSSSDEDDNEDGEEEPEAIERLISEDMALLEQPGIAASPGMSPGPTLISPIAIPSPTQQTVQMPNLVHVGPVGLPHSMMHTLPQAGAPVMMQASAMPRMIQTAIPGIPRYSQLAPMQFLQAQPRTMPIQMAPHQPTLVTAPTHPSHIALPGGGFALAHHGIPGIHSAHPQLARAQIPSHFALQPRTIFSHAQPQLIAAPVGGLARLPGMPGAPVMMAGHNPLLLQRFLHHLWSL